MWQGALEGETKESLIQLRIPKRLKAEIETRAERQRVTLSRLLRLLIEEELASPGAAADERRRARWQSSRGGVNTGSPRPRSTRGAGEGQPAG
jgi:hypothetical protein